MVKQTASNAIFFRKYQYKSKRLTFLLYLKSTVRFNSHNDTSSNGRRKLDIKSENTRIEKKKIKKKKR